MGKIINQTGQTTVEYILIISVVVVLIVSVFNSKLFQDNLGPEGKYLKEYKQQFEFAYRNAYPYDGEKGVYSNKTHPSYIKSGDNETRFFIPKVPYPGN